MSKALADLLESALEAWYGSVAGWNPPGRWTVQQCSACPDSPFTEAVGLDAWPHELAHELVGRLDAVVGLLRESIEEFDVQLAIGGRSLRDSVSRRDVIAGHAEAAVLQALAGHEPAIRDVLEQCVGRRLDEFLSAEAERVIASLR